MKHTFVLVIRSQVSTQTCFRGSMLQVDEIIEKENKNHFHCLQNDAQRSKFSQCQGSYYAIPIHDPKMGLGLKIVKNLSPSGLTPLPRVTEQRPGSPLVGPNL